MNNLHDLLAKLQKIEENTGDEKFDTMMGNITKQPDLEPDEVEHFKKFDKMLHQLGELGKIVVKNPELWQRYENIDNNEDHEWVWQLIEKYTGASQKDILDLSDIIEEFATRGSGIMEFAWAVQEGTFDEDFIQPWNEYKLSFNTMEEGGYVPRKSMAQTSAEWSAAQAAKKQQTPQPTQDTQSGAAAADECMTPECGDMGGEGKVELSMSDLLKLVAALQKGQDPHATDVDQPLMGDDEFDEVFGNEPAPEVASVAAVTPTGDDMHSKGDEAEKVNGGGNPLQAHLAELYAQIKESPKYSDIPAVQRKKNNPNGNWKVSKQDLDAEDKAGKISHKDNLAKNNGTSLKEANEIARRLRKI